MIGLTKRSVNQKMSPKTKEQFEEIRHRSMACIKEVALELFAQNGFHHTSVSQIATAAGISKGLIYNYFESKEALLQHIILEAIESAERMMDEYLKQTDEPAEQLKGITEASVEMVQVNLHYWKLMASLAFQTDVLAGLEPVLRHKQQRAIVQMEGIFRRLGLADPLLEAYMYSAMMDGMMIHYMHLGETYPLDEMKNKILSRYKEKVK